LLIQIGQLLAPGLNYPARPQLILVIGNLPVNRQQIILPELIAWVMRSRKRLFYTV